jgi:hypothetical protein
VTDTDGTENNAQLPDPEATQGICISSTVAQGATTAAFFDMWLLWIIAVLVALYQILRTHRARSAAIREATLVPRERIAV